MRKKNLPHFTPLIRLSIILTASIVTAKCCYGYIHTCQWLMMGTSCFFACIFSDTNCSFIRTFSHARTRESKGLLQSYGIYTCVFLVGCLLTSHEIDLQMSESESTEVVSSQSLSTFDHAYLAVKDAQIHVKQLLQELGIKDQNYAVITAMTLGDKTAVTPETKDIYSISGASHVLAISGLHIGIIFQLFILAFGGRKRHSVPTLFFSLTAIWAYVFFIGFPASAVRSATMISICSFAILAHREALSLNNLAFAYCLMLTLHPLYLFDISFQMSFLAIGFILLLMPIFRKAVNIPNKWLRWTYNMACLSVAAQIGTTPIIAYYFGRISCYSLLTSFIAIPAATLILYLSAGLLFSCALSSLCGMICTSDFTWATGLATTLMKWIANGLINITEVCNSTLQLCTLLPKASIEGIQINIPQLCLIYIGIIAGYIFIRRLRQFRSP